MLKYYIIIIVLILSCCQKSEKNNIIQDHNNQIIVSEKSDSSIDSKNSTSEIAIKNTSSAMFYDITEDEIIAIDDLIGKWSMSMDLQAIYPKITFSPVCVEIEFKNSGILIIKEYDDDINIIAESDFPYRIEDNKIFIEEYNKENNFSDFINIALLGISNCWETKAFNSINIRLATKNNSNTKYFDTQLFKEPIEEYVMGRKENLNKWIEKIIAFQEKAISWIKSNDISEHERTIIFEGIKLYENPIFYYEDLGKIPGGFHGRAFCFARGRFLSTLEAEIIKEMIKIEDEAIIFNLSALFNGEYIEKDKPFYKEGVFLLVYMYNSYYEDQDEVYNVQRNQVLNNSTKEILILPPHGVYLVYKLTDDDKFLVVDRIVMN